jgi:mono/diheme cytochrome c family protein
MIGLLQTGAWAILVLGAATVCVAEEGATPAATPEAELAKFREMKSPVAYTKQSVSRGAMIYRRMCTECHGLDGKAQIDVVANATNLTNPEKYFHGTTEGEIFHSIRDGAGIDMPPFKTQIQKEEDLWNLTNFVLSLWPEDKRPKLQNEEESSDGTADGGNASPGGADHESDEGH